MDPRMVKGVAEDSKLADEVLALIKTRVPFFGLKTFCELLVFRAEKERDAAQLPTIEKIHASRPSEVSQRRLEKIRENLAMTDEDFLGYLGCL